jgi:hypothetical protein
MADEGVGFAPACALCRVSLRVPLPDRWPARMQAGPPRASGQRAPSNSKYLDRPIPGGIWYLVCGVYNGRARAPCFTDSCRPQRPQNI